MKTEKTGKHETALSYEQAQKVIVDTSSRGSVETRHLDEALGAVAAFDVDARIALPHYDQSLRDGFVIGKYEVPLNGGSVSFKIVGEIAAGQSAQRFVGEHEALRIMTGAPVPGGAERVVQQEDCSVEAKRLIVPIGLLKNSPRFINERGTIIEQGSTVLKAGTRLDAQQLEQLAASGNRELRVFRKARIGFFCTGSELVDFSDDPLPGMKISSNRNLLNALIKQSEADPIDFGIIEDTADKIGACFTTAFDRDVDVIISTGGTGAGRYDLLEQTFRKQGGAVLFNSLAMRPGRTTLFGTRSGKLYFGLPGPPAAVASLFNELVSPAIQKIHGSAPFLLQKSRAILKVDNLDGDRGICKLIPGHCWISNQLQYVRTTDRFESANCHIILGEVGERYRRGDLVTVNRFGF